MNIIVDTKIYALLRTYLISPLLFFITVAAYFSL